MPYKPRRFLSISQVMRLREKDRKAYARRQLEAGYGYRPGNQLELAIADPKAAKEREEEEDFIKKEAAKVLAEITAAEEKATKPKLSERELFEKNQKELEEELAEAEKRMAAIKAAEEDAPCVDEGCPNYGTPHSHVDPEPAKPADGNDPLA